MPLDRRRGVSRFSDFCNELLAVFPGAIAGIMWLLELRACTVPGSNDNTHLSSARALEWPLSPPVDLYRSVDGRSEGAVLGLGMWVGYTPVVAATVEGAEISYDEMSSKLPVFGRGSESPLDIF